MPKVDRGVAFPKTSQDDDSDTLWDPFAEMQRMKKEMDRMFQDVFSQGRGHPGKGMFNTNVFYDTDFDIEEKKDEYIVRLDISGMDKEKIDVDINEHSITVSGQYSQETKETSPGATFQSKSFGSFLKTVPMPDNADPQSVKTEKQEEFLIIRLPKKR